MCFKWLARLLAKIPNANSAEEIYELLRSVFPNADIYISDSNYGYINKASLVAFLAKDKTDAANYIPEDYDCDDFSFRLMGQFHVQGSGFEDKAIGIIWLQQPVHALNVCVTEERKVLLIEPQTDKVYARPEDYIGQLVVM